MELKNRILGSVIGSGIGDALGAVTEFLKEDEVKYKFKFVDNYVKTRSHLALGEITDDTYMMLCVLESLLENQGFNGESIARNFVKWYQTDGRCCGRLCRSAILSLIKGRSFSEAGERAWIKTKCQSAGNGGIMRNTPIPIYYMNDFEKMLEVTESVCKITHYDPRCVLSCKAHSIAIYSVLNNLDIYDQIKKYCCGIDIEFDELLDDAKNYKISDFILDDLDMGYTYIALKVALCAIFNYDSFEEPLYEIVNKGGDADTNACVACGLLGAKYGLSLIHI